MSQMKYESELYLLTKEYVTNGKVVNADKPTERINIPVHSFEVEGGTNRKINLTSTDETSVAMEFEQARAYTNFIFYIPPTKDFLALRLMEFAMKGELFDMTFIVNMYSHGKKIQTLRLSSGGAVFRETPVTIGGATPLLRAKLRITELKLMHGHFDPRFKKIVHKVI